MWATCKVYPSFSQDEYASVLAGFTSLAAGSSFYHSSGTEIGGRADTFTIDWIMLQQYQILVKTVIADAGDGLSQAERDTILYLGYNIGLATDVAKAMTQLFSQKYDHAVWNATVHSFDIPPNLLPIAGICVFVLWSLEGKLPVPGLDSLIQSLLDALVNGFGLTFGPWLVDVYTPAVRKALSFSNLRLSAVLPVLEHFLKFVVTFVEALVFQEQRIPVPDAVLDVWRFFDQLGLSSDLLADMEITWEYYNGFNCRTRSDHGTWHEKAAYGFMHSLKLAEIFNSEVVPTSSVDGFVRVESTPTSTELPDELGERDPVAWLDEMDKSGDGFLSQEEVLEGVQRKWYTVKDETFEQKFAPVFAELFPLADVAADGKLNVEEVQVLIELLWEQSERGLPHLLGTRRREGFHRIWAIAGHAAWHAANTFAGYDDDAANDLKGLSDETFALNFDWVGSPLQPFTDSVKLMARDFAWYACNHTWDGVNETSSPEYASYVRHREEVKRVLNGAGAPADELFSQINQMVIEYAWMAANDRYWWWWPGHSPSNEKAEAHWAAANEQLNQLFARDAWPLFDQ